MKAQKNTLIYLGILKIEYTRQDGYNEFDEQAYLTFNTDIYAAVERNEIKSGLSHFIAKGHTEQRIFFGVMKTRLMAEVYGQNIVFFIQILHLKGRGVCRWEF